jgi:hypothetical protein
LNRVDWLFLQINITEAEAIQENTIVVCSVTAIPHYSVVAFYSNSLWSKLDHKKSYSTPFQRPAYQNSDKTY